MTDTIIDFAEARRSWETPPLLFKRLDMEFKFTLDAAASADNAQCLDYWTKTMDAFTQCWNGERIWCNPPYDNLTRWVTKARDAARDEGSLVVMLLPCRTEQTWFRTVMYDATEIAYFNGRINFVPARGIAKSNNREASVLVVFQPGLVGPYRETVRCWSTGAVLSEWRRLAV